MKAGEAKRLEEARILAGMLADRMMAAYVVGGRPSEAEVRALCTAVLLLEEHGLSLPPFAEDVIARLLADEAAGVPVQKPDARSVARRRPGEALGRMLRPLRLPWAA